MMRKFLLIGILFLLPLSAGVFRQVPGPFSSVVEKIEALPEAEALLQKVEREGTVSIVGRSHAGFAAYWEGRSRTIVINQSYRRSEGSLIRSVVFELCNATRNRELARQWALAGQGRLTQEEFATNVERIEFENLWRASRLLEAGIKRGLFPSDARMGAWSDFDAFLRNEKRTGHFGYLCDQYRML